MERQEIIERAERFCRENEVSYFPVDVYALCKRLGITVITIPLPKEVSGFIVIQEEPFQHYKTGRIIACNRSEPRERRRFTVAHELGHYVLHRQVDAPIYAHRDAGQESEMELEANLFAANILMPEQQVRIAANVSKNYPVSRKRDLVALQFDVSREAAGRRLEQLQIR